MKIFKNGIKTGLILQLAIGPVFFFIINLALQKTIVDGLAGVIAVTIVDYIYITLAVLGIGKLLKNNKFKKIFGIISSIILIIFGIIIIKEFLYTEVPVFNNIVSKNLFSSFLSVFILTISNPMTIIFFTSIFTTKAIEHNYTKKDLIIFGLGVGLATLLFMGISVILLSLIKETIPVSLIKMLNLIVGFLLIGYGCLTLIKIVKKSLLIKQV